jgi:hypothetical protein
VTRQNAIDLCGQGIAPTQYPNATPDYWKTVPGIVDMATKIVASLIALGILKVSD